MAQVAAAEIVLLDALRNGDEKAFAQLVGEYHASLVRVARIYVSTRASAEEVVQETWLAVLNGLDRFEGRSSLRTWIFRILTNIAKTRGQRDARAVPFSALGEAEGEEPSVEPERFAPPGARWQATGARIPSAGTSCRRSGCSRPRRSRASGPRSRRCRRHRRR